MGSDVLLLPDSIHQMVLLPLKEGEDPESYRDTVRSANEYSTDASSFLSNRISHMHGMNWSARTSGRDARGTALPG